MNYFLDKVGLQHLIEKIQIQLGNYLSLSGGVIGGGQSYSDISNSGLHIYYSGDNTDYELIKNGNCDLKVDGLYISMDSTGFRGNAVFNAQKCEVPKFVLTKKEQEGVGYVIEQEGLLANDSTEVVKELSDEQVDKLLAGDTSTISDSKYYVSGANLGRFAQNVAKDNSYTIIYAEGGNVEVKTSNGNMPVEPGASTRIDGICPVVSGQENVISLVYKGYAPNEGLSFTSMVNLKTAEISDLNTSNVTDMSVCFANCTSLSMISNGLPLMRDIRFWDTRKVTSFYSMFRLCESLTILDLRYWNTQKVTNMSDMFSGCTKLANLNLEGWDTRSVSTMVQIFEYCSNITSLQLGEGFGRMQGSVGSVDFSMMSKWTNTSVDSLTKLYDRRATGMSVITLKLSTATKNALGTDGIRELTDKGYTIA